MRSPILALLSAALLSGCAGYAADYLKSKESLLRPQLARFGLSEAQVGCVGEKLETELGVWQLRQLSDTASRVQTGGGGATRLTVRELLYVSRLVNDPKVGVVTAQAVESCGVAASAAVAAPAARPAGRTPPAPPQPQPQNEPESQPDKPVTTLPPPAVAPTPGASVWVNLGAAETGQSIAVDASSVQEEPPHRKAWFRLSNPGEPGLGTIGYLLRIDCTARTITPTGSRRYDAAGAIAEEKDYGPEWEGALPIEAGTVMEIAYRALCTG